MEAFSIRRLVWWIVRHGTRALLLGLALVGAYLGVLRYTGNFHTVIAGELYRSAQLTPMQFEKYVKEYGIKTIINLRGVSRGRSWYEAELSEAARLGTNHIDFGISARRQLTAGEVTGLIALMKNSPKPILIHCEAGADRSGLASALYLAAIKRSGEDEATGQLSIWFGHISLPFIPEYAMDRTFDAIKPSLEFLTHGPRGKN
jgi:protein tyrosine/serine phosphatase